MLMHLRTKGTDKSCFIKFMWGFILVKKKNNSNPKKPNNSNNKLGIAICDSNIHESNIHKLYNRVLEP
jgi:hypothetical protein